MANQLSGRRTSRRSPTVQTISVSARDQASAAQFQITNLLRLRHKIRGEDDFTVRSQQDLLQTADNVGYSDPHAGYYGKHLAGGRHRHYEHHAGVGDRAHSGNWPAQSDWRNEHRCAGPIPIEAVILSTVGGLFGILLGLRHAGGDCPDPSTSCDQSGGDCSSSSCFWGHWFGRGSSRSAARLDPILALRS